MAETGQAPIASSIQSALELLLHSFTKALHSSSISKTLSHIATQAQHPIQLSLTIGVFISSSFTDI
jgi:hypothetical protein